ncbi:hypothetical protein, partial [Bacteroides ovatus]
GLEKVWALRIKKGCVSVLTQPLCFFRALFILFLQPFLKEEQSILKIEHTYFLILSTFAIHN